MNFERSEWHRQMVIIDEFLALEIWLRHAWTPRLTGAYQVAAALTKRIVPRVCDANWKDRRQAGGLPPVSRSTGPIRAAVAIPVAVPCSVFRRAASPLACGRPRLEPPRW